MPEKNLLEDWSWLFYAVGQVTHFSRIRTGHTSDAGPIRPLELRAQRAELLDEFYSFRSRQDRQKILDKAKLLDEIAQRYLRQSDVSVELPHLGMQRAKFLRIEPVGSVGGSPIVLLPGISNDLEPMSGLIRELVSRGKTVICVGYPEASLGLVTREFVAATVTSSTFEPHVAFFGAVIKKILEQHPEIEIWGFSTGAPIAAEVLADHQIQRVTTRAVFLSPAAVVEQTPQSVLLGIASEMKYLLAKFSRLPRYPFVWGKKTSEPESLSQDKVCVFNALLSKVSHYQPVWAGARIQENGEMLLVSGGRDDLTKSRRALTQLRQANPRIKIVEFLKATHITPLVEPQAFVERILSGSTGNPGTC